MFDFESDTASLQRSNSKILKSYYVPKLEWSTFKGHCSNCTYSSERSLLEHSYIEKHTLPGSYDFIDIDMMWDIAVANSHDECSVVLRL